MAAAIAQVNLIQADLALLPWLFTNFSAYHYLLYSVPNMAAPCFHHHSQVVTILLKTLQKL